MPTGNVQITIADGASGVTSVPGASVQVVIGCASGGPTNQVVATKSPATLQSMFTGGPLVEAGALSALAGGTILAMRAATNTAGSAGSVHFTGTGTSVITVSGTPTDDAYVEFLCVNGGTVGSAGITFMLSFDAGRTFGPVLALGTANTYAIPGLGCTLNFAAGTLVSADLAQFKTTAPSWNDAGIQAALLALQNGPYAGTGWGSMHVVGVSAGADATAIEGYLDTMATNYVFTRAFLSARDASPATAWAGTGEAESAWMTSIQTDFSAVTAKRLCVSAGHYNMPSAFPTTVANAPRYRRPLSWAAAARQVVSPAQRHIGRVRDGALGNIVVSPTTDPLDGFIYHDESINPGLDATRFMAAMTRRPNLPGFFIRNPNLMSQPGSDFSIMPLGNVMDVACNLVHQVGQLIIDSDVRLNANGTIYENDARAIESSILGAINTNMTAVGMISSATVVVSRTQNVQSTSIVVLTVTITARGYVLEEDVTIGFSNPNAQAA